jgi:GntP family gluconate:H+ symporter
VSFHRRLPRTFTTAGWRPGARHESHFRAGDVSVVNERTAVYRRRAATRIVSILLAWLIAAVLHLAIGSISVAAITTAGIIGPAMAESGAPVVIIGLVIGAGALFALQVNSNFFWMFQTLLGVSTSGALKALTFVTALASVVALILIALLGVVV